MKVVEIIATLPPNIRQAVITALDQSNANVESKPGGFRESGFVVFTDPDDGKQYLLPMVPGQYDDLSSGGTYHYRFDIDPVALSSLPASASNSVYTLNLHVHPAGRANNREFEQQPSSGDIANATSKNLPMNVVIGARNQQVYFYNASGVVGQTSLRNFLSLIR